MIATYHTWNSTKEVDSMRLIRYINQSLDDDYDTPQIFRGIDTPTIQGAITAFKENDVHRKKRKRSVAMYHEILSFAKGEDSEFMRRHPEKLQATMEAYINIRDPRGKAMGYGKAHLDRDNVHIHHAFHGCEIGSNKTLRMSRFEFNRVRYQIEKWQMKYLPELKYSIIYHDSETGRRLPIKKLGQGKSITKEFRLKQNLSKEGKLTQKTKLKKAVEKAYKRSTSEIELEAELLKEGIELNYRNGKCNGIRYNNKSYRFETIHAKELITAFDDLELQRQRKRQLDLLKQRQKFKEQGQSPSFHIR